MSPVLKQGVILVLSRLPGKLLNLEVGGTVRGRGQVSRIFPQLFDEFWSGGMRGQLAGLYVVTLLAWESRQMPV